MIRQPRAFLLDEPLSNLDAGLRTSLRAELARLHDRLGVTTVYVTHDQVEAMTLGTRVAVLRDGVLQQCGTPLDLYERPANLFVAGFIGSPRMNLAPGRVENGTVRVGDWALPLPAGLVGSLPEQVVVGIRPSDFHLGTTGGASISVTPAVVEELGSERQVVFPVDAPRLDAAIAPSDGNDARLLADDHRPYFVATLPARTPVAVDQPLELTVDLDWVYVFDPADGRALR
jgi:multiple sugar transport system ATP-binding protein